MSTEVFGRLIPVLTIFMLAMSAGADPATTPAPPPTAASAPSPSQPCSSEAHGMLAFWVGEWKVANAGGQPVGSSRVERLHNGCVMVENYVGSRGNYSGMSLNTFDPEAGEWSQHWVDSTGLSVVMKGKFEGKNLVYWRSFTGPEGGTITSRMTFFDLEPGKVRQLVEQSSDGGTTWTSLYDLHYTQK